MVDGETWPSAGEKLLDDLRSSRDRYALIAAEQQDVDSLVERMSSDLALTLVRMGSTLASHERPPTTAEIQSACGTATILADIDVLFWPELGVSVQRFLAGLARRRATIAVWPGEIINNRARYSALGRPDHHDERLADVVVLRPRITRFPDEMPYDIERITR